MAKTPKQPDDPQSTALKLSYDFFGDVLKRLKDPFIVVLWGVEVLLFSILVLMIVFQVLSRDQNFVLVLVIIATVIGTYLVTVWRLRDTAEPHAPPAVTQPIGGPPAPLQPALAPTLLADQARQCLTLLVELSDANRRNIQRGRGGGSWARMQNDTYNHVCQACRERRLGGVAPDAYIDALCAEPDFKAVCDKKWVLGETLDVYRRQVETARPTPGGHDDLERLIRRSITQPDCSPGELDAALSAAIERAKAVLTDAGA
jgi:hypothetical protein